MNKSYEELLNKLLISSKPSEIDEIISELGTRVKWIPIGNNPSNYAILNVGTNPYEGITERITNAIDAIIELAVESSLELKNCENPRQAIERIYGFGDGNLKSCDDDTTISTLASNIKVKFQDSGDPKRPTLEISDKGIGQHPYEFPNTLLGLNEDYKVSKLYLMGAFGHGGQMSFSNCEYGVIISRKSQKLLQRNQPDLVGWSIVRYRDRSDEETFYKYGVYEYCIDASTGYVPSCSPSSVNKALFNGTIIKLIAYGLPKGTSDVLQPSSTAWSFLSQSLFDPLLPFSLHEERKAYEQRKRSLSGLARRLWRGGKGEKVKIRGKDSYEINLGKHGTVRLNYWALSPTDETENWKDIRKGYVTNSEAGFFTLNGQTHERFSPVFLRDAVRLSFSSDYLIVQVDCDNLTNPAKKELLSTVRERFKDNEVKEILFEEVASHLRQDRYLLLFEQERIKIILSTKSKRDTSKIREMVTNYIANNDDLRDLLKKKGDKGVETKVQKRSEREKDEIRDDELETPELNAIPTYLLIKNSKDPIPVERGGNALVRLETDAEDSYMEFDWDTHFRAIHKGGMTERHSESRLRNGKISYYIHCPDGIKVGSVEEIRFELDVLEKEPIIAERKVVCVPPFRREEVTSNEGIREPLIVEVSKNETPETWGQFGWDEKSVGRVMIEGENSGIYVSVDNEELRKTAGRFNADFAEAIRDRYVAGVAYYLLLKKSEELKSSNWSRQISDSAAEEDNSPELQRLAKVISALSMPIDMPGNRIKLVTSQIDESA